MSNSEYRSWRRGVVLAAVCVAALALAACASNESGDSPSDSPADAKSSTGGPLDPGVTNTSIPSGSDAEAVAADFLAAYADTDQSASDWHAGIAPYLDPWMADTLDGVDPGKVPFSKVTGDLTEEEADRDDSRVYSVATDRGTLIISMAALDGQWQVFLLDFDKEYE